MLYPEGLIGLDSRLMTEPETTTAGPQLSSRPRPVGGQETCQDGNSCGEDIPDKPGCEDGECDTGEWCYKVSGVFWSMVGTFGGSHCVLGTTCDMV